MTALSIMVINVLTKKKLILFAGSSPFLREAVHYYHRTTETRDHRILDPASDRVIHGGVLRGSFTLYYARRCDLGCLSFEISIRSISPPSPLPFGLWNHQDHAVENHLDFLAREDALVLPDDGELAQGGGETPECWAEPGCL